MSKAHNPLLIPLVRRIDPSCVPQTIFILNLRLGLHIHAFSMVFLGYGGVGLYAWMTKGITLGLIHGVLGLALAVVYEYWIVYRWLYQNEFRKILCHVTRHAKREDFNEMFRAKSLTPWQRKAVLVALDEADLWDVIAASLKPNSEEVTIPLERFKKRLLRPVPQTLTPWIATGILMATEWALAMAVLGATALGAQVLVPGTHPQAGLGLALYVAFSIMAVSSMVSFLRTDVLKLARRLRERERLLALDLAPVDRVEMLNAFSQAATFREIRSVLAEARRKVVPK